MINKHTQCFTLLFYYQKEPMHRRTHTIAEDSSIRDPLTPWDTNLPETPSLNYYQQYMTNSRKFKHLQCIAFKFRQPNNTANNLKREMIQNQSGRYETICHPQSCPQQHFRLGSKVLLKQLKMRHFKMTNDETDLKKGRRKAEEGVRYMREQRSQRESGRRASNYILRQKYANLTHDSIKEQNQPRDFNLKVARLGF